MSQNKYNHLSDEYLQKIRLPTRIADVIKNLPEPETVETGMFIRVFHDNLMALFPGISSDLIFSELKQEILNACKNGQVELRKKQPTEDGYLLMPVDIDDVEIVLDNPTVWISTANDAP